MTMYIRVMVASVCDPDIVHSVCGKTVTAAETVALNYKTCCEISVAPWGTYEVPGPTTCLGCIAAERSC